MAVCRPHFFYSDYVITFWWSRFRKAFPVRDTREYSLIILLHHSRLLLPVFSLCWLHCQICLHDELDRCLEFLFVFGPLSIWLKSVQGEWVVGAVSPSIHLISIWLNEGEHGIRKLVLIDTYRWGDVCVCGGGRLAASNQKVSKEMSPMINKSLPATDLTTVSYHKDTRQTNSWHGQQIDPACKGYEMEKH